MKTPDHPSAHTQIRRAALALLAGGLPGCARAAAATRGGEASPAAVVSRPAHCLDIDRARPLQPQLDAAPEGSALCLPPGTYAGPLRIDRRLTVYGPREAVLRSSGEGTTVRITAPGAALLGLTVDGSGGRYDLEDAAVSVQADGARVEGVTVRRAVYGILVQQSRGVTVRGNDVEGTGEAALGLRGDGIRLWETRESTVEGNTVRASRDLVVWYSPNNRVANNDVRDGRYGTHLMYSSGTRVEGNRYANDVVGVFVMYSHDVAVEGNTVSDASGAAGMGLGLKDSGGLRVRGNVFLHDTVGVYLDQSPNGAGERNEFSGNAFALADSAVVFHASQTGNAFTGNAFRDNRRQVVVEGGGDALGTRWEGNEFDDYEGYDLDGDGVGDVPYELRSLSDEVAARSPGVDFFRGTPVLALLDVASKVMPLFAPQTVLVDARPRTRPAHDVGVGMGVGVGLRGGR